MGKCEVRKCWWGDDGSGFGKRGNDEVRKCWWGYVKRMKEAGKSAGKEARNECGEECEEECEGGGLDG